MKKQILLIGSGILFVAGSLIFTSCGNTGNKEKAEAKEDTEMVEQEATVADSTAEDKDAIAEVKYQCPMKCEGDKTYDKPGKCPVCGMDLKAVNEEDHDHDGGEK